MAAFFKHHRCPGRLDSLGECPHVAMQQDFGATQKAGE
jgi:hypothetical protein